jgi:hypothetical protein
MKKLKLLIKKLKEKRRVSEICKKVRSHKNSGKIEKQYDKTIRHFKRKITFTSTKHLVVIISHTMKLFEVGQNGTALSP